MGVNRRTWTLIGAMVLALGIGLVALGQVDAEADVRFVEDVLDGPERHGAGTYTLLGRPQPEQMPVTGPEGVQLVPNPSHGNETRRVTAWVQDGVQHLSTHVLVAENGVDAHGAREVVWHYRNETRVAGGVDAVAVTEASWTTSGLAFQVEAFDDGDGHQPRIWALYDGVLPQPLAPKPSQFTGRLAPAVVDGAVLPGALVWHVDGIVAQCSSKFLPPEEQAAAGADPIQANA